MRCPNDLIGRIQIQVLQEALQIFQLTLVTPDTPAKEAPERESAFIAHLFDHWFTLRRFGPRWYNLDSTLDEPAFVGDLYLSELLRSIQQEGMAPKPQTDELAAMKSFMRLCCDRVYAICCS